MWVKGGEGGEGERERLIRDPGPAEGERGGAGGDDIRGGGVSLNNKMPV